MGISKKSRKGKKAWRKNIDASEVEEFIKETTHQERRGPAVEQLADEDLFFVDKQADETQQSKALSKRAKRREPKLLKSQAIIAGISAGIHPVKTPTRKPKGSTSLEKKQQLQHQQQALAQRPKGKARHLGKKGHGAGVTDIWAEGGVNSLSDWTQPVSGNQLLHLEQHLQKQQQPARKRQRTGLKQSIAAAHASGASVGVAAAAPAAVEVDLPGCSFNPEPEAHQEALAVVVASEVKKALKQELAPKAPPALAPEGHVPGSELDELLVDAEREDGEQEHEAAQQQQAALAVADANAIPLDDDSEPSEDGEDEGGSGAGTGTAGPGPSKKRPAGAAATAAGGGGGGERKTRKDRNRETRRKAGEVERAARAALKAQRRELEDLPQLQQELEEQEAAAAARRERAKVVAAEKAAQQPPRLGKHKFEALPPPVMTTDEVTGSLRQIQPCFLVTQDRFKSLQKRGLVEPRRRVAGKKGKKVAYMPGARREKAEQGHEEIVAARKARKLLAKKGEQLQAGNDGW